LIFRRLWACGFLAASLLLAAAGNGRADESAPPIAAQPARAFLESIGMNTHLAWRDKSYSLPDGSRDVGKIARLLAYLGVTRIRNSAAVPWLRDEFRDLARTGTRLDLIISDDKDAEPLAQQVGDLVPLAPFLIGIEGPNEADLGPQAFEGEHGPAAVRALQRRLYALIRETPALDGVPILETSIGHPDVLAQYAGMANADRNNMHSYFFRFDLPMASELAMRIASTRPIAPGKPVVTTETGWPTRGAPGAYVPEPVRAIMVLDDLLDQFRAGVLQTYIYQLIDEPPSRDFYGMFLEDGTPKPAAVALHNLTRILADPRPLASARSLPLGVSGLPPTGAYLLLEKGDGSFWLAVWNGAPFWNPGASTTIDVPDAPMTVQTPGMRRACLYDPLRGTSATAQDNDAGRFTIAVPLSPLIVALRPGTGSCPRIGA
jgi:hypothetical protein